MLNAFCTTGKLELELMYKIQVQCYEDAKLMKLFPEIIKSLYDQDVLAENTILHWFRKGTNPKGRYATCYTIVLIVPIWSWIRFYCGSHAAIYLAKPLILLFCGNFFGATGNSSKILSSFLQPFSSFPFTGSR